jgi:hypothetical protein
VRARKEIKPILIAKKMKRWHGIARCPLNDVRCLPSRARKNFQRLVRKYPEIAEGLGLNELSVYLPI